MIAAFLLFLSPQFSWAALNPLPVPACSKTESDRLFLTTKEIVARHHCRLSRNLDCEKVVKEIMDPKNDGSQMSAQTARENLPKPSFVWPKNLMSAKDKLKSFDPIDIRFTSFQSYKNELVDNIDAALKKTGDASPDLGSLSSTDLIQLKKDMNDLDRVFTSAHDNAKTGTNANAYAANIQGILNRPSFKSPSVAKIPLVKLALTQADIASTSLLDNKRSRIPKIADLKEYLEYKRRIAKDEGDELEIERLKSYIASQTRTYLDYMKKLSPEKASFVLPFSLYTLFSQVRKHRRALWEATKTAVAKNPVAVAKTVAAGGAAAVAAAPVETPLIVVGAGVVTGVVLKEILKKNVYPKPAGDENDCGLRLIYGDYEWSTSNGICGDQHFTIGENVTSFASLTRSDGSEVLQNDVEHCEFFRKFVNIHADELNIGPEIFKKMGAVQSVACGVDGNKMEVVFKNHGIVEKHTVTYRTEGKNMTISQIQVQQGKDLETLQPLVKMRYTEGRQGEFLNEMEFVNPVNRKLGFVDTSNYRRFGNYRASDEKIAGSLLLHQVGQAYHDEVSCCAANARENCFKFLKTNSSAPTSDANKPAL